MMMYILDSMNFKSGRNLDINTKNVESLSINRININNSKNTVLSTIYTPLDGDLKDFNTFLIYSHRYLGCVA